MRVFVAGASGVLGLRLLPLLIADGHEVAGMTRTPAKREVIADFGAEPVLCDVYDVPALVAAMGQFVPEVVLHELTDLPDNRAFLRTSANANSRIREEGTRNLVEAARVAGAPKFIAQSVAWDLSGDGARAKRYLEETVLGIHGVVLRYGQFYGPGTYFESDLPESPRIHIDDAARRTVLTLAAPTGIIELVDELERSS